MQHCALYGAIRDIEIAIETKNRVALQQRLDEYTTRFQDETGYTELHELYVQYTSPCTWCTFPILNALQTYRKRGR